MKYRIERGADGTWTMDDVWKRGAALLQDGLLNKGTAFTAEERERFGLEGMLPATVTDRELQGRRAYEHISRKGDHPLEKWVGMAALQDRNETLFYQVLDAHIEELLPIVYTPTVGEAAVSFSHVFRRGRGLWITPEHRGRIFEVLGHVRNDDIRLIVVTDNERILGLGDQGAGGIVIPVGKLALYTLAAGIHPAFTLPVSLDVGTDNPDLLADELYAGWPHPRLRGSEYDALVAEFVEAVRRRFPHAVLQWEDFKKATAFRLLDRFRHVLPSFNDDIQGTAAVVAASIVAAGRATGTKLGDERILLVGAGAAGVGIARHLRQMLAARGLSDDDAERCVALVDTVGLVVSDRPGLEPHKRSVAWRRANAETITGQELADIVDEYRPSVLVGTTGRPGIFDRRVVQTMARHVGRPLVMALSNPTSKSEALPADVARWSDGRALIAAGSPFPDISHKGRTIAVSQCNNVYVFPGVGLGALVSEARIITDAMFASASETLAGLVSDRDLMEGRLVPPLRDLRRITREIAAAVAMCAYNERGWSISEDDVEERLDDMMWDFDYPILRAV